MRAPNASLIATLGFTVALAACGSRSAPPTVAAGPGDDIGFTDTRDVVIVGGTSWVVTGDLAVGECVTIAGQCVKVTDLKQEYCGDVNAQADIVIVDGKVAKVICYPPKSSGVPIEQATVNKDGETTLPQNGANKVITFGPETDGKPTKGDLRLDGEKATVIGNGVEKTILGGNLALASNGAHIRGLAVQGNVVFENNANDSTLAFCKVKGNLVINANNVTVMNCQVWGNVEVVGNGATLLNVGVGGKLMVTGNGAVCEGNYSFVDKDSNFIVAPAERGAALSCKK